MAARSAALPSPAGGNSTKAHPTKIAITPVSASSPGSAASPTSDPSTPISTSQGASKSAVPLAGKMVGIAMANPLQPKTSITSKEWVIPPRPKPGRKPATDTPPTKRKAQNRAAQRAFRERRAARVGELEEQLDEQREEHEREQEHLQNQVSGLDAEVQSLRSRCVALEDMLEKERTERAKMASELEAMRRRWGGEETSFSSRPGSFSAHHGSQPTSLSAGPSHQPPRGSLASTASTHRNSTNAFSIAQIVSPPDSSDSMGRARHAPADPTGCGNCSSNGPCACVDDVLANTAVGCGRCSVGTKCECLEAALNSNAMNAEPELKRRPSSISAFAPEEKRQRPDPYPNEIDFTPLYASKKKKKTDAVVELPTYHPPPPPPPQQVVIPPRDSCGFCKEGTYCMCAEAAASQPPQLASHQVQTPPPSENDVGPTPMEYEVTSTGAIKLPGIRSLNRPPIPPPPKVGGCGPNGPGSCTQCLGDAKSGLFCRSLAANFEREAGKPAGGCCGGGGGAGCCKSGQASVPPPNPATGINLSCADAYKTLSSHRNFDRAADEIGTWLPKLRAAPRDTNTPARLPIEVEAASIMGVLKEFDVRFGREP
ncbi:hypothetical protein F4780DRAFT_621029 [Xylariomycetidae sp. FL0641]|nr:hypothetical protein F4780DRAFT_621029 [Xylariomycetidae sp. FL0641]